VTPYTWREEQIDQMNEFAITTKMEERVFAHFEFPTKRKTTSTRPRTAAKRRGVNPALLVTFRNSSDVNVPPSSLGKLENESIKRRTA
jgi:hypothetical protein